MTALYLLLSLLSGTAFYLGTRHQRVWAAAQTRHSLMRVVGWLSGIGAAAAAIASLGVWAGVFAALTAIMLVMVAWPCSDAVRQLRAGNRHVG